MLGTGMRGAAACALPAGAAWALRALLSGPASAASGKGAGDAAPQLLAFLLVWNALGGLLAAWALGPSAVGATALDAARGQWRQTREAFESWFDCSRAGSQRVRLACQALWRSHPRGLVVAVLALGAALAVSLRRWVLRRQERSRSLLMASPGGAGGADGAAVAGGGVASSSSSPDAVTEDDLAEFLAAVDGCDGPQEGPWEPPFFSRETSSTGCTVASMRHRRSTRGPTQLRVLSEYELGPEGLSPEGVRDFFYDDRFRSQWDKCITQARQLGRSADGATELVYYVRKFPSFCTDKDYVIARRTWENSAGEILCVTKASRHERAPDTAGRLKRVTEFRSCWRIRQVPSTRVPGASAVELLLVHEEGLHIPDRLARFAVRHMFGWFQRDVEPGIRAWHRRFGAEVLERKTSGAGASLPEGAASSATHPAGRGELVEKVRRGLKVVAMVSTAAYLGGVTSPVGICGILATTAARRWAAPRAPVRA